MGPLDRGGLIQNKSFYSQPVSLVTVLRVSYSLSLICLMTSEDIKHKILSHTDYFIVQELCESRGGRPGLSVLTSLLVSVDVKTY